MQTTPFRHTFIDDWVSPEMCRAACAEWPNEQWIHWLRYEGERGTKYVTKDVLRLTPTCTEIIRDMTKLPIEKLTGIAETFPDTSLYGAGMSWIPTGGELPLHLDSDHHPIASWERSVSAVLYLSECEGGELSLWNAEGNAVEKQIAPRPGRLVLFECTDVSWHSVSKVVTGRRLSVSMFFWRIPTREHFQRSRAEFRGVER